MFVHQLFEAQVQRTPDNIAVTFEGKSLTYGELDARANQLARHLQVLGVGPEILAGICMERSHELVVAMLGILKAGGACLPLDPSYPKERLAFALEDARPAVILAQERLLHCLPLHKAKEVCLDADWNRISRQSREALTTTLADGNLAFLVYTSGSTGHPKAVMLPHQKRESGPSHDQGAYQMTTEDRHIFKSPIGFTLFIREIFWPLLTGGNLIIASPGTERNISHIVNLVANHGITLITLTPSILSALLDEPGLANCTSLRHVSCFGEPLSYELRMRFFARSSAELSVYYGATEAPSATFFKCARDDPRQFVELGQPLPNKEIHLLDDQLQPVPLSVCGELYIGGQLARGYFNRPDITAERFIPNPFARVPGTRLYRTGDLGRHLADGSIEFVGRADHQVKIRGFRIELGEIEAALRKHRSIHEVSVLAREDAAGDKRLVAYVVPVEKPAPEPYALRRYLKDKLPEFMVPSGFVFLDALPSMANGKLDRCALLALKAAFAKDQRRELPQTQLQRAVAGLWAEVLGVGDIGLHDNFFDLGGHSLSATKLLARLQSELEIDLPARCLFESPTVVELSARLATLTKKKFEHRTGSYVLELASHNHKRRVFCFPYLGGFRDEYFNFTRVSRHFPAEFSFCVVQSRTSDGMTQPRRTVEAMAADYLEEIRKLQPHGPYFIIGECQGGIPAYETARQLKSRGETVALLALFDTQAWSLTSYFRRRFTSRLLYRRAFGSHTSLWPAKPWIWQYFQARTAHHLKEMKKLGLTARFLYAADKLSRASLTIPHELASSIVSNSHGDDTATTAPGAEVSRRLKRAEQSYFLALCRYHLRPYEGRITLLVNEQTYASNPTLGWDRFAVGGLDVHKIPGNHDSCIPDNISLVAKILGQYLAKADAREQLSSRRA
jgi:amino acid adenylation domain-containing protein